MQFVWFVSLNLMLTVDVERSLGSNDPVNVMLSPPRRLRVVDGKIYVKVQTNSSGTKLSAFGITPRVLVKIGK
jgi:hypothetical protein